MIGIGLGNEKDITLKGLEAIKNSKFVFYENYTSTSCALKGLQEITGKVFKEATRDLVENRAEEILDLAVSETVSFLVTGDVFGATTHTDMFLRAKTRDIDVKIINNASIINVVGNTGLELYRFGQVASIVFDDNNWLPDAPYNVIKNNKAQGLHTLCLLDIKVAEPSLENLKKEILKPEPPRFMTINKALEILEKLEQKNKEGIITQELLVVGVARLGCYNEKIFASTFSELKKTDFKEPLHSLIIPGKLHDIEIEMLKNFGLKV